MSRTFAWVCSAFLAASFFANAAFARDWIVPAAAHAPGAAGTNWRTDLRIVNPAATAAEAGIDLLPQGLDNSARSQHVSVSIPARGQLSVGDVLASKFGFTGTAALLVSSSEPSLVVTSRTFNEASGGATYGQFIPGVVSTGALSIGAPGQLIYVTKSADYRTNVGYAGTTGLSGTITVKLFDASGFQTGSGTFDVQPYGQGQINDIFGATGAPAAAVARAVVTSSVPLVAYASVIDNRTGDPMAIIAARESEASTLLAIPGIAHLAGAASSLWRSDVRLFHPGQGGDDDGNASVTLTYYPGGVSNPAPVTRTVTIGANQLLALDDILLTTFGIDNGSGALRIESTQKLLATSRTYNLSGGGTFGQDIPAVAYANGIPASSTALLSGLTDAGYRTNAGFFNLSATPLDLTLTLERPDGSVQATKPFHLDANAMAQFNLFAYMGAAATSAASLAISGAGSGSYWAYASVIDNTSGDAVFIPATISTAAAVVNPPPNPPVTGDCVTIPFMRAGLVLGYRTSDGSYSSVQTILSDSASRTEMHDQANAGGTPEDIDTTVDYVTQGDLRAITHALSKATVHAGPLTVVANTDITYSPALVISPVSSYCAGATFVIPGTTQTVSVTGTIPGPTTSSTRAATTGEILAVRDSFTTAAGTFSTVKYRSTQGGNTTDVAYSIAWVDIATGVLVRQQEIGPSGNTVQILDLISMH
jgi:hypothetical protein